MPCQVESVFLTAKIVKFGTQDKLLRNYP